MTNTRQGSPTGMGREIYGKVNNVVQSIILLCHCQEAFVPPFATQTLHVIAGGGVGKARAAVHKSVIEVFAKRTCFEPL
jgi:hypothetical protein